MDIKCSHPGKVRQTANIHEHQPQGAQSSIIANQIHIDTIQEIYHKLKGATRISELELNHEFH